MAGPTPARSAALATLRAVRGGALADLAFAAAARDLPPRDRAFALELAYGTLRMRGRIDHILGQFSTRPLAALDPDILDVLRLGVYQLTEMGGVPAYAAISQSVELSRRTAARGAAGFVNGVLHNLRRAAGRWTFPALETDPVAHLTTWGSHPQWLVERWVAHYGADSARRLIAANNQRPRLYLRLLGDVDAALRSLAGEGLTLERVPLAPRAVGIDAAAAARALACAPAIVQDPAAGLVASFLDAPAGATVLDLAAAPGGKALAIAADRTTGGPRFVVAADVSLARMARVHENVARLRRPPPHGLGELPVGLVVADGRVPPFRSTDVVLLDAPCTGTGTLRRHPDGRWRLTPRDLAALTVLQAALLDAAATLVAPGGLLLYATCSLEPEENEAQVESFMTRHPDFTIEPGPVAAPGLLHADGRLRVLPQEHGFDGAFAARLRRRHSDAG